MSERLPEIVTVDRLTEMLTVGLIEEPIRGSYLTWVEASQIAGRIAPHLKPRRAWMVRVIHAALLGDCDHRSVYPKCARVVDTIAPEAL